MPRVKARGKRAGSKLQKDGMVVTFPFNHTISQTQRLNESAKFFRCYEADEQYVDWLDTIGYFPVADNSLTTADGLNSDALRRKDRVDLLRRSNPFKAPEGRDSLRREGIDRDISGKGQRKVIRADHD